MAIRIEVADLDDDTRQRVTYGVGFADVPEHLRPSGFRHWLDRVPAHPDITNLDHCVAAFGEDIAGTAELAAHHLPGRPPVDPHWRSWIASAEQWEHYAAWCAEHGLVAAGVDADSRGAVPREWSWTEFRRWEDAQR